MQHFVFTDDSGPDVVDESRRAVLHYGKLTSARTPDRRCTIEDRQVDALYRLTPEDFVAARESLSRSLRAAGDKELSAQVKALRRPSVAAWLINQLAREHSEEIDELLETGSVLRDTQNAVLSGRADGARLQALTAARRQQIDALVSLARTIAADAGRSTAPLDAVDATLIAATADPAAATAVQSGRLVTELSYSGFGLGEDLADAVAPALKTVRPKAKASPPAPAAAVARDAHPAKGRAGKPASDGADRKRAEAAAAAKSAVRDAQDAVHEALGLADDAQRAFDALTTGIERSEVDEARLEAELASLRADLSAARERQRTARSAAKSAHADAERARTALVKAQQRVDHAR